MAQPRHVARPEHLSWSWYRACDHEAAHAIVSLLVGSTAELLSVFVNSHGSIEGQFHAVTPRETAVAALENRHTVDPAAFGRVCAGLADRAWVDDRLTIKLAGMAVGLADDYESAISCSHDDCREALVMAQAVAQDEVMARHWLCSVLFRAAQMVDQHRTAILSLSNRLAITGHLNAREIESVLAEAGFPAEAPQDECCLTALRAAAEWGAPYLWSMQVV